MLPTRARLRTTDVKDVLAHGTSVRAGTVAPHMSVKILKKSGPFRAAIVMPKSIAKSAVVRNRIRRAAYRALESASLPRNVEAVFFIKKIPSSDSTAILQNETHALIQKIT